MDTSKPDQKTFAVCVDNKGYPASLELHKIYRVIPDPKAESEGDMRVIDESGEDYLYSQDRFVHINHVPLPLLASLERSVDEQVIESE